MPLRAVLFDLDDTLCDTEGCRRERFQAALRYVCAARPDLDLMEMLSQALMPGPEPREVRGLHAVLVEHGLEGTPLYHEAVHIFTGHYDSLRLFPDVHETLGRLAHDYELGLVTNAEAPYPHEKLAVLDLARYFSCVVISGVVGIEKPDPGIFQHALSLMNVSAQDAAFVGDRLNIDVAGAKAAGMSAVWFNHWGGVLSESHPRPDAIVERFSELPAVLSPW